MGMAPEDPFFFFCAQNFALCTYPADCIPKHFLSDPSALTYQYSDIISRTGTPEPDPTTDQSLKEVQAEAESQRHRGDDDQNGSTEKLFQDAPLVPPSICLCQPTELSALNKQRWEIKLSYVDTRGLILGDAGWYPGALGQRFCFECKSENIDHFLSLSEVPQGQLLYMEHKKVAKGASKRRDQEEKHAFNEMGPKENFFMSSESSSEEEEPSSPSHHSLSPKASP